MNLTTMEVVVTQGRGQRRVGGTGGGPPGRRRRGSNLFQQMNAGFKQQSIFLILALGSLVIFWFICLFLLVGKMYSSGILTAGNGGGDGTTSFLRGGPLIGPHATVMQFQAGNLIPPLHHNNNNNIPRDVEVDVLSQGESIVPKSQEEAVAKAAEAAAIGSPKDKTNIIKQQEQGSQQILLVLSRNDNVKITADVHGNLGPPEVMIQKQPGTNWLKDRWQAASNMHGTAIPGSHWVQLEFPQPIEIHKIILDWEAAYADDYILLASLDDMTHITTPPFTNAIKNDQDKVKEEVNNNMVWMLFDGTNPQQRNDMLSKIETGQSPGVKTIGTPLHVIHTIDKISAEHNQNEKQTPRFCRYLKLWIQKPGKNGWGVSLWQIDVYGVYHQNG